jgi:endonuclease/exonuclease/phosphatase family metal-dependent hydrolase
MPSKGSLCVLSWNVSEKKADLGKIEGLFSQVELPCVICLQEVPKTMMEELNELASSYGYSMHSGLDKRRQLKDKSTRDCYLVVLTQCPVQDARPYQISNTAQRPLITNLAIPLLRLAGKWDDTAIMSGMLVVDIDVGGTPVRIITAHLSLTDPDTRRQEFSKVMSSRTNGHYILCGDFNILQGKMGRAVNFLIGGSIKYALNINDERNAFDTLIDASGLRNPLAGYKTHSAGQLDHILYSNGFYANSYKTMEKRGSDHRPIQVCLELV